MFPAFAHVPAYPLVFPLFWGAVVVLRPRDGPPPAGVRRRPGRPNPFGGRPAPGRPASSSTRSLQTEDVQGHPGRRSCTPAIFWGFVLLTIGTANIVTGGLVQAVISIPFDGALWAAITVDAERRRGDRPAGDRAGPS